MAEPTTPTLTLTVAAISGAAALPASFALGDYGVVLLSALAAALVQISARELGSIPLALITMARIVFVSLALSVACAWMLAAALPKDWPTPPGHVSLALCSFFLGLADGNWKSITSAIGNWLVSVLPKGKQ